MKRKDPNIYPKGLTAAQVRRIIAYYDSQTDEEAAAEIDGARIIEPARWIRVPEELVPQVQKLIAHRKTG
jgi:hypothetical protein